ncbi:Fpg/Nei family DNA glycosylase [Rhodococcus aerolatus]
MPELPEVDALAGFLRAHAVGSMVGRVDVAALNVLKTFDPPVSELSARLVTDVTRHGKHLDVDCEGLHLVVHLSRAGWLRWSDALSPVPPRPGGKSPIALRVHLSGGGGFDLTEAGTQKRLAVWLVTDPQQVPGVAALGPDALSLDLGSFAALLAAHRTRLKTLLVDQRVLAGIGNAYSDEILHVAKLSPFATAATLKEPQVVALHTAVVDVLTTARDKQAGQEAARLKGEKRSGMRVHARTGLPCPVCGDTVREVSFTNRSFQYCPTCQTGGRVLADRRMSKLLR